MGRTGLTWVEISQRALKHNVSLFRQVAGPAKLFAVIKSNAYGHGVSAVVSVLNRSTSVDGYMVFSLEESLAAVPLTRKPIVILGVWQKDEGLVREAIKRNIVFPLYDLPAARWLNNLGKKMKRNVRAQIKVDVGTRRLGFRYDDEVDTIAKLCVLPYLRISGLFSHFADSESFDESFTSEQERRFSEVATRLEQKGFTFPLKHIACSAAALRSTRYCHDAVRIGIALYGLWPSQDIRTLVGSTRTLKSVLTWKTKIIQIKRIKADETVGYGMSYRTPAPAKLAILPVGYWDGYDRKLSNSGHVLIHGRRCPVRGRVCMNVTMVELPPRLNARVGDEVILVGSHGRHHISIDELARIIGTINYEVTTRINPLLPRVCAP